jgi:hypothetical protein
MRKDEQMNGVISTLLWCQLLDLAAQSDEYINNIIEMETGPDRQKKARQAYARFAQTVIDNDPRQQLLSPSLFYGLCGEIIFQSPLAGR